MNMCDLHTATHIHAVEIPYSKCILLLNFRIVLPFTYLDGTISMHTSGKQHCFIVHRVSVKACLRP
jgi:hypothetical protein